LVTPQLKLILVLQVAPGWICGKAVTGVTIQAVGVVDKSVAGPNYMRDMARIAAVKQLSEVFKDYSAKAIIRYLTLIKAPRADAIKAGASTIKGPATDLSTTPTA
jgi:hypothetical protein